MASLIWSAGSALQRAGLGRISRPGADRADEAMLVHQASGDVFHREHADGV